MKFKLAFTLVAVASLWLSACATPSHQTENLAREWTPAKVAVLPFQLGVQDSQTNRAISPITGATFHSGEVTITAQVVMDQILEEELMRVSGLNVVERDSAFRVFDAWRGQGTPMQAIMAAGRELGVDGVIIGYIYRFSQRVGGDFGVNTPASAAFDLNVIRVSDGRIMWRNSFDHTQTSLSQNLLDARQFVGRGLRWFTVEEFAQFGMEELLRQFPWQKSTNPGETE